MNVFTSIPNVSTPCVTVNPCTCPVYGPGGVYQPVPTESGYVCWLALESPSMPGPAPVPALSEWAVIVTVLMLTLVGARRLR